MNYNLILIPPRFSWWTKFINISDINTSPVKKYLSSTLTFEISKAISLFGTISEKNKAAQQENKFIHHIKIIQQEKGLDVPEFIEEDMPVI